MRGIFENKGSFVKIHLSNSIAAALGAAILFGASTPVAKFLIGYSSPVLLAGLLYLGSGIGLMLVRIIHNRGWKSPGLKLGEWLWFLGAIGFGGIIGPVLLMYGLTETSSANASLLLNLEAVLTSTIAWVIFKENTDKRIIFGMLFIVLGGLLLAWPHKHETATSSLFGSLAIAGACLCWALDNNFTRKISAADSFFIAGSKGLAAGVINIGLAMQLGANIPTSGVLTIILICGFFGYGVSLLLFILALRGLGTSRTGAYFSIAPFVGAGISILFFREPTTIIFWIASLFMIIGIWLHLTEIHDHEHIHRADFHEHFHLHDEHHQHTHDFECDERDGHSHPHDHESLTHTHHHYPDINHIHNH